MLEFQNGKQDKKLNCAKSKIGELEKKVKTLDKDRKLLYHTN